MKVRTGFVSNSSSSSFCIFGAVLPENTEEISLPSELEYSYGISDYYDSILVGTAPWNMKEDETRKQFEERVTKEIKKTFGPNIECRWHIDGGYNG